MKFTFTKRTEKEEGRARAPRYIFKKRPEPLQIDAVSGAAPHVNSFGMAAAPRLEREGLLPRPGETDADLLTRGLWKSAQADAGGMGAVWRKPGDDAYRLNAAAEGARRQADRLEEERETLKRSALANQRVTGDTGDRMDALRDQSAALRQQEREYRSAAQAAGYNALRWRPDFAERSGREASARDDAIRNMAAEPNPIPFLRQDRSQDVDERYLVGLEHTNGMGSTEWIQRAKQLTNDELSIYNYLRNTEGQESAGKFLDYMEETLNQRLGGKQAEDIANIENPLLGGLAAGGYGLLSGVDQFGSGVRQLFSEEALPATYTQFGAAQVRENLADAGPKLPEWMGDRSLGQAAFEGVQMIGNMLPSIAVGTMAGGAGLPAWAAKLAGAGTMGTSAGGNAYNEAVKQGYTPEQARGYGTLVALSEGGLSYLLGGIGKLGGKVSGKVIQNTVKNIDNALLRAGAELGLNMLSEGTEEYLQEVLNPVFRNIALDEDNPVELVSEDAIYAGIMGALTAGLLEGPGHISSAYTEYKTAQGAGIQNGAQKNASTGEAGGYTPQEADRIRHEGKTFRNIVAGIDTTISRFFDRWKTGRRNQNGEKLEKLYIGKMNDAVGQKVSSILGYEVAERDFIITNDDVKHIMDQHGDAERELRRGNRPLEPWVFEALPEVLSSPDSITPGHTGEGKKNAGKTGLVFSKAFPNGRVVSIQFDNKGRGTLEVTTLYVKEGTTTSEMDADKTAPIRTSKTPEPVLPSGDSIPQPGGENNTVLSRDGGGDAALREMAREMADEQYAQTEAARAERAEKLAGTLGENGKKAFFSVQDETADPAEMFTDFARAYNAGKAGQPIEGVRTALDTETARIAYYAGQNDADAAYQRSAQEKKSGFVESRFSGGVTEGERSFYEALGKASGTRIIIDQATGTNGYNGYYKDGEIHIAADADTPGMSVAAHEATHRLQQTAPEAYAKFRDYAVSAVVGAEGVDALVEEYISRYAENGVTLNRDTAMDEIAADYAMELMVDEAAIRRAVADDRSMAQKFLDIIKELIDKVKAALGGGRSAEVQKLERSRRLWLEALKEGGGEQAQKNAARTDSKIRYSFGGERAGTADLSALGRAKEMAERGESMDAIFRETGWYTGADGKWRFEIDDSGMEFRREGDARLSEEPEYRRMEELTEKWSRAVRDGESLTEQEQAELEQLQDQYSELVWEERYRLDDFLKHDALFRAYPRLRGVSLVFDGMSGGEKGYFSPRSNTIVLSDTLFGKEPDVLLHEIQHILQRYEGFARGSSPGYWNRRMEEGYSKRWSSGEEMMPSELYRNTAGEIEARDAAARRELTAEERRDRLPDRGDENTVFADDTDGRSYSIKEEPSAAVSDRNAVNAIQEGSSEHSVAKGEPYVKVKGKTLAELGGTVLPGNEARYSIKRDHSNRPFVEVEEDILEGVPEDEWVTVVKENLKQKFPSGITVGNNKIHIDAQSRREMTYSRYMQWLYNHNPQLQADKLRATNNADEILLASTDWVNEGLNHPRKDKIIDFARGNVLLRLGNSDYTAEVVVGTRKNGAMLLYDILNLQPTSFTEKETAAAISANPSPGAARSTADVSEKSIAERLDSVKEQFSLKGAAQLQRQVRNLQERNTALREQLRTTKGVKTDARKTAAYAKELLSAYESSYDADALASELLDIYNEIANSGSGVDMEAARAKAQGVANRVLEQSVRENREIYEEYASLRDYLKKTKINVPRSIWAEFDRFGGYNNFRKGNMGRLSLSSTKGMSIDSVYAELSEQYPELFDEAEYTNPADQLINLSDVLESIQPVIENPYSADLDMASRFVASEILEAYFDIPQQAPTFADRQKAKLEAERAKGNRRLAQEREKNRERLAQLREEGREQARAAIQREREKREERLSALREKYAARDAAGRERRSARELRAKIQRHVKALSQKLTGPSDKQHIPEELRGAVAAMLEAINLESQYSIDPTTGKRSKSDAGDPTKRTEAFRALREQYEAISKGRTDFNGVLDPDLLDNLTEVIAMKDIRLADMSVSQLAAVWQTVRAIEQSVSTANKLLSKSRFAGVLELAENIRQSSATKRTKGNWRGPAGWSDKLLNLDMMNSLTFLHLFGEGGDALYRELQEARDNWIGILAETVDQAQRAVGKADVKALRKKTHTFHTEGGELKLTTAQLMSLYELNKRKQAQDHIYKGGIRATAQDSGVSRSKTARENLAAALGKVDAPAAGVKVSQADVAAMLSELTEEEIKIADGLQAIMQGYLAQEGNRESMKVYGYQKFTEKDYFPISSDPHQVVDKIGDVLEGGEKRPRSIAEWGSAKGTVDKANNGILLGDIFDVFAQHAVDMATYASHLGAMEDMNRVRSFTFRDGEGNRTGTMGDIIQRVAGQGGGAYLNKLLQDVSAGTAKGGVSGLAKLTANYKAASVGLNLRVALQQPTSYLRAAAVLDPKYLADPRVLKKGGWEKALKNAPIARWKDWGNFEINQGRQLQDLMFNTDSKLDRARNFSMKLAGAMDSLTWGRIWNACELEVMDKRPSLTRGSAAFNEAVAQRFTDVVDRTQVVDNVLGRSQIMRSGDNLAKMATSYMGESTQSYNLVYRAFRDWTQERDSTKRTAARKQLGRAVVALTASQFVNAIAQALWDAVRDDDDRDEKYWERVLGHILPNFADNANPVSMVPYAKDVLSVLQGYDVKRMDMAAITSFISACQNMSKAINGEGRYTLAGASANMIAEAARIFGLPAATVKRDLAAIARSVGVETGDWYFQYQLEKTLNSVGYSGNRGEFYDIAFGALKDGELDVYQRIVQDLMEQGVKAKTIESAMRDRLKAAQEEDESFTIPQEARDLIASRDSYAPATQEEDSGFTAESLDAAAYQRYAAQRAEDYRDWADTVQGYSGFSRLDAEGKDKALKTLEQLAADMALVSASGGQYSAEDLPSWERWATGGESYGVSETEAALFKLAYDTAQSDKDKNGKTISGSRKENTLEEAERLMPWLTDEELEYLMANFWTPDDRELKALKDRKFMD